MDKIMFNNFVFLNNILLISIIIKKHVKQNESN